VPPTFTLVLDGVTAMDTRAGGVLDTVSKVLPETVPLVAVMVVVPTDTPVARPVLLPMVAAAAVDDCQVTEGVMSAVEPSE
jgi:hypothetical protein